MGISFGEDDVEVSGWNFNNIDRSKIQISKEQVLYSLKLINESLGTNYKLSKIYFSPFDIRVNGIYSALISVLIRHYYNGNEFLKV